MISRRSFAYLSITFISFLFPHIMRSVLLYLLCTSVPLHFFTLFPDSGLSMCFWSWDGISSVYVHMTSRLSTAALRDNPVDGLGDALYGLSSVVWLLR